MAKSVILYLLPIIILGVGSAAAHASKLYKWRDQNGIVHYGDAVPPRYARNNREVINNQGITLESLPGRETRAERQATARRKAALESLSARQRRDRVLLDTYTSVDDLERVRNNRLDALQSQIHLASSNVQHLERQVASLETQVNSLKTAGKPVPTNLTKALQAARSNLLQNRRFLQNRYHERIAIRSTFAKDIARFKALKAERSRG
jgi:predicted  nucleic acid-binding Zn-ribbon protein